MRERPDDEMWLAQLKYDLLMALDRHVHLGGRIFSRALLQELERRSDDTCRKCCQWLAENIERIAGCPEMLLEMMECAEAAAARAWRKGQNRRAEAFATLLAACGDADWLAFLARRGEVERPDEYPASRLQELLDPSVSRFSAMSMVNMALTLMLSSGTEADWRRADALFALIPPAQVDRVFDRWLPMMIRGEVEGHLVMLMLQRHRLCARAVMPDERLQKWYLQLMLPGLPSWLRCSWQPGLDDLCSADSGVHAAYVQAYLDRMPCSRASAEELLDAIVQYDDLRLYEALLDEDGLAPLLSPEELAGVRVRYAYLFDIPDDLPGDDDWA